MSTEISPLVFISYAKEDYQYALALYKRLRRDSFRPWLDQYDLLPGTQWDNHIRSVIRNSRFFIALVSSRATSKRGYINKELSEALDAAQELPEGKVFIIPVRIEETKLPERLRQWQSIDLFKKTGYQTIKRTLLKELNPNNQQLPIKTKQFKPNPFFEDSADGLICDLFNESGGLFQFCTIQKGKYAITNGHWLQFRTSIPKYFLSLKDRCDIFGPLNANVVKKLLESIIDYQHKGHHVNSITFRDDDSYLLNSNSNSICRVNKWYLNIVLEAYQNPKIFVLSPTDPVVIEDDGEIAFLLMPMKQK